MNFIYSIKKTQMRLFSLVLFCCSILMVGNSQVTPPGANTDAACGADCWDWFNWGTVQDGSGTTIPNFAEGVATDNNCFTSIEGSIEYSGSDSNGPNFSGIQFSANNQGTSTDCWTVSFGTPLTNPVFVFDNLETGSVVSLFDCNGAPISASCIQNCGNNLTGGASNMWTGDNDYHLQTTGTFTCIEVKVNVTTNDAYNLAVGTCLGANIPPPCATCGPNENYEFLSLANASGSGTGATADVFLNGALYGTATVVSSNLSVNEDLSGSAFGAFADGDAMEETFVLCMDLCAPITVQQVDILGLETESQAWLGTGLGAGNIPTGLTLTQCGGSNTMIPTGNMVTNTASSCANQSNGNYTVGGVSTSSLCFRYTNPVGGCSFDKATFRIGACVPSGADAVPTCPLTYVTYATDVDDYILNGPDFTGTNANAFQVMRDANGNFFNQDCSQIENEVTNMTPTATTIISPCAEVVDEVDCAFCTPQPPCTSCGPNETYEYLSLANTTGSGTGATADVFLNGVLYGDAEVLFSNVLNEDLSGSAFGALANGNAMEETFILQVNLCEAITVQQIDILGLETESQVWVGNGLSGTGMAATPTGPALVQCAGSNTLAESGNMVTNTAGSCANQSNGFYNTTAPFTTSTLYFRYTNPVGGCRFDKTTYRIGACVPDMPDAIPVCPLTYVTYVTDVDDYIANGLDLTGNDANGFQAVRDANGNHFNQTCSQIQNEVENAIVTPQMAISPCAEVVDQVDCSFCTPIPPCTTCGTNETFGYLTFADGSGSGTGATANVYLDGVKYGDAEVLFSNVSINEDLTGPAFGAIAVGNSMEEVFLLRVNLCEAITVQQVDIIGLETESEVWVGTGLSGAGMTGVPTGPAMTQCGGDDVMAESGNMVTNTAASCSNQGDGNYTVGGLTTNVLYFRYRNPQGGCSLDKTTWRIGACIPDGVMAAPTCPLNLYTIDECPGDPSNSTFTLYQDANGLWFPNNVCTDPVDEITLLDPIQLSPCATTTFVEMCAFCCELVVTCPPATLPTITCNVAIPPAATTEAAFEALGADIADDPGVCGTLSITSTDVFTPPTNICNGRTLTRTYTISDDNDSFTCTQTMTISAPNPPVITCPANRSLECSDDTSVAANGMATATADCGLGVIVSLNETSTQANDGSCNEFRYTITRVWTATDDCGRIDVCTQTIDVDDTTSPVITCPADITIECDEDTSPANTGVATAMDNCAAVAEIVIVFSDVSTQGTVGCAQYRYTITRTWTATDPCGNSSTCVQTIDVDDTTSPVITCPANMDGLDCLGGPIPVANTIDKFLDLGGTIMDNCSRQDEWSIAFGDRPGSRDLLDLCSANPADRTVTRTYRITDICGNASTCTQTFTFNQSLVGPIITEIPLDQTITCASEALPQLAAFNVEIDCGLGSSKTVEALPVIGTPNCPGARYQFRYTVVDACGRIATHTQTYTIQNEPFEYICPSFACEIDCSSTPEEAIATFEAYTQNVIFVTSCNNLDPVVSHNFDPNSLGDCGSQTTVNFTATDPCGRTATCQSTIVVVDTEAPIISGSIPSVFRNCGTFAVSDYQSWAEGAINSIEIDNNCDNTITWSYSPNTPNMEYCGTGTGLISTTNVTFTATDNCGNASMIGARFYLKDRRTRPDRKTESGGLRTESDDIENGEGAGTFTLYQNQPNPFKDETMISFDLPESTEVNLLIHDISGRLIYARKGDFEKGYNNIVISKSALKESSGILYYSIQTPTDKAVKKMLFLN